jgi:hypothetical protein
LPRVRRGSGPARRTSSRTAAFANRPPDSVGSAPVRSTSAGTPAQGHRLAGRPSRRVINTSGESGRTCNSRSTVTSRRPGPAARVPPPGRTRQGPRADLLDRAELHRFAALAGITDDQIVAERFLAVHVVTHVLPGPEDGLAGRPAVAVPGSPGVYLAGDWVGPSGWLSDAAMASGQHAGMLAAGAPAEDRTYPRVA